jgi:hypothetical protein
VIQKATEQFDNSPLKTISLVAAAPTKDFDAKWGSGYVSPDVFTKIVFAA